MASAVWTAAVIAWRANWYVLLVVAVYAAGAWVLSQLYDFDLALGIYRPRRLVFLAIVFTGVVAFICLLELIRWRPSSPFRHLGAFLVQRRIAEKAIAASAAILLLLVFFSVFTSLKSAIKVVNPFAWDQTLFLADRMLHGGSPWQLLHPFVGSPAITKTIDTLYMLWIPIMLLAFGAVAAWTEEPVLRARYLLAFMATWIVLGSVGATLLSSAGPLFYGRVVHGDDPFKPLLIYINHVAEQYPLSVILVPHKLWNDYLSAGATIGSGISAMPSVHVAVAMLNALVAFRVSRCLGVLAGVYLLIVMVGSVHLGWHYALDGYVSVLAVAIIWVICGQIAPRAARSAPGVACHAEGVRTTVAVPSENAP
jgi:hypothetical protein